MNSGWIDPERISSPLQGSPISVRTSYPPFLFQEIDVSIKLYSSKSSHDFFFSKCAIGKSRKLLFSSSDSTVFGSLELVHSFKFGDQPMSVMFVVFNLKCCLWMNYIVKLVLWGLNLECIIFVHFKGYIENVIKILRSDLGMNFTRCMLQVS